MPAAAVVVARVDIDRVRSAADELNIQSVPTFVAFRRGAEVRRASGVQSAAQLAALAGVA